MSRSADYYWAFGLLATTATAVVLFAARIVMGAAFRSDRGRSMGGSAVLGQWVIDLGYWLMNPIVRACLALRITPNMLTWASFATGVYVGVAYAQGQFGHASVMAAVSAFLDILDGQVARRLSQASAAGEVLDAAVDRYSDFLMMAGLAIWYRQSLWGLTLALAATQAGFMISYTTAKAEAMGVPPPRGTMRRHERIIYLLLGACLTAVTGVDHPMFAALGLIAVVGNLSAVRRFIKIGRLLAAKNPPTQ